MSQRNLLSPKKEERGCCHCWGSLFKRKDDPSEISKKKEVARLIEKYASDPNTNPFAPPRSW